MYSNPKPYTPNPKPYTLNPKPFPIVWIAAGIPTFRLERYMKRPPKAKPSSPQTTKFRV